MNGERQLFEYLRSQLTQSYLDAVESGEENLTFYRDTFDRIASIMGRKATYNDLLSGKVRNFVNVPESADMVEVLSAMEKALQSEWATRESREQIYQKSKNTLQQRYNMSDREYEGYIDLLNNRILPSLMNNVQIPSEVLMYINYRSTHTENVQTSIADQALQYLVERSNLTTSISEMYNIVDSFFQQFRSV